MVAAVRGAPGREAALIAGKRVYVGVIAYNAEKTLERVVRDVPPEVDWIVVADDHSGDGTVALAGRLGLPVISHERNLGYGENQKSCLRFMLRDRPEADVLVVLHGDYQYDPRKISEMAAMLAAGEADVALGVRRRHRRAGGMPLYKRVGSSLLDELENLVYGQRLADYATGYRAYARALLEEIDFSKNSGGFLFDTEMNAQVIFKGRTIGMVDVETRYFEDASSLGLLIAVQCGIGTLMILAKYLLAIKEWRRPALFFPAE
jgi:glycosyltransferase involved in cell wall biosynthesis